MKIKRNSKGFTLVELLAVVTILGIIAVLSITAVTKLINKSKDEQKDSQKKTAEMAAESYLQANKNLLPKSIGETTTIKLKNLKETNYLKEDLVDADGKDCMEKSYVVVSKKSASQYTYKTYLYCGNDVVPDREKLAAPKIDVVFYAINGDTGEEIPATDSNFLNKVSNPKYRITIDGDENGKIKVDSYNYSISARIDGKNVEVYSSGTLSAGKNATKVIIPGDTSAGTVTGDLKDYVDITKANNVTIHVIARNANGVTYEKKTSLDSYSDKNNSADYKDNEKPTCDPAATTGQAKNENDWINKSTYSSSNKRTITVTCKDNGGSDCVRKKYTKTWPNSKQSSAEYAYIQVEDNAKNKSLENDPNCKVRVNIDLVPPEVSLDAYKSESDTTSRFVNGVTKTSVGNSSDSITISESKYKDSKNDWLNNANYPHGIYYKVTIKDNLYLKSYKWEVNKANVKDTNSSNYKNLSVDNPDGVKEKKITATSGSCNTSTCTFYVYFKSEGKRKGKLTVIDRAGNKVVFTISANLDRTAPPIPNIACRTAGDNASYNPGNWTGKSVITKPSIKDTDLSGFNKFEYSFKINGTGNAITGNVNKNDVDGYIVSDSGRNTIQYRTMDNAGNYSDYKTTNVYVDKQAPNTPTVVGYHTSINNNNKVNSDTWKNKNIIVVGSGSSDNLSGMGTYKVRATGNQVTNLKTVGNSSSGSLTISTEGTTNVYFKACDNVGNCSSESAAYIAKVDKSPPSLPTLTGCLRDSKNAHLSSCSGKTTVSSSKWYKGYITVTAAGSVDALSGFKYYHATATGANTKDENQNRLNFDNDGVTSVKFYACDNAGNCSTSSSNFTVQMDNLAPNAPTVKAWRKTSGNNISNSGASSGTAYPGSGLHDGWLDGWVYTEASGSSDTTAGVYQGKTSGFSHYRYTTSGTTTTDTNTTGGHRNINSEGKSTISYQACDKVGNCSSATSMTVKLDRTDPVCTASKSNTWSTSGVKVTIGCSDKLSGCKGSYPESHSGIKGDYGTEVCDNARNCSRCGTPVSSSYECDTCGGGSYSYRTIDTSCTTAKICVERCGGVFIQSQDQTGHSLLGQCRVWRTGYYDTYPCNCAYYYY